MYLIFFSCYWDGERCDIERDFQQIITDLGVCYSFNSNSTGKDQYSVSEEGIVQQHIVVARAGVITIGNIVNCY